MSRDRSKLKVFAMADELVIAVYRTTKSFPSDVSHKLGFLSKADREQSTRSVQPSFDRCSVWSILFRPEARSLEPGAQEKNSETRV
jgi:hypothetical protein